MEEEAKEAAAKAEREALEAAQKVEEERKAREDEKRHMQLEEERRKESAHRKLLELEEKIAKREAEKKQQEEARFVLIRLGGALLGRSRTLLIYCKIVLSRGCFTSHVWYLCLPFCTMYQIGNFLSPRSILDGH